MRREFTVVYYGKADGDSIKIDNESSAYEWIPIEDIKEYPMADSQRRRIEDVLEFCKTGKKRMG